MIMKLSSVLLLFFFAIVEATSITHSCTSFKEFQVVKSQIRRKIISSPEAARWPARLLRAGFHDCLPKSCDASIQFELDRSENDRIDVSVAFLRESIKGTCSSLADALKIGMELSMELSGGPRIKCKLGTEDTKIPNPTGQIPQVGQDFATIIGLFTNKGFTKIETLAGNFGGHSLGQFQLPDMTASLTFDSTPAKFNNDFARFVVTGNTPPGTPPGSFNALPSDTLLQTNAMKQVALFARNEKVLRFFFSRFLSKMCAL